MSKFEPPAWVTEHLRIYRESGGTEGHLWEASAAGVPGLVPPYAHHDRATLGQEADVAFVL